MKSNRREFLKRSAAAGTVASLPFTWKAGRARADVNSRLTVAAIGVGGSRGAGFSQGTHIARKAAEHARMIAVCDVDSLHMDEFTKGFEGKLKQYADYRELLEKEKPDLVTIGTPDHWHVPIAIAAMHAGCDVYCEKPLTLTIEEGIQVRETVKETGRVFQVGTQQRSEHEERFLRAIAIVNSGRLGKKVNAFAAIGGAPADGPFPYGKAPEGLNWDMWVGPAQQADYCDQRRKEFRWYYDYSGGKMTDWGAHHIDISQWGLGLDHTGPVKIRGKGTFGNVVPEKFNWVEYFDGNASLPNGFNTPVTFAIDCEFENGAVLHVCDNYVRPEGKIEFNNGILFEGEDGRIFVDRGSLKGRPVEEMTEADKKDLHDKVVELYGSEPGDHMRNFFDAIKSRGKPISDVETHHRTMTTCHLCNIALMLGRELRWDPNAEKFAGDDQAAQLVSRPRRNAYSWTATT
jgi:predicted dehydrogenase